jgi:predicted 3-demethylubiquinone-9 3-methyltransferase (glyoxalase superfamily)
LRAPVWGLSGNYMTTGSIVPCLWLDDQAEAAAAFYTQTFPEGRVTAVTHYPQSGSNPSGKPPGSVLTVDFELAGKRFTALNGGSTFVINPSISFFVQVETTAEVELLFTALGAGGEVLMPLGSYPWSESYAWVKDRFGVTWQLMKVQSVPGAVIVPCLMFVGSQHGKAEAAMRMYTDAFPDGRIESVERYAAGEGPEGTVKHARFVLNGQEMVAMDSHGPHAFTFNEGLSLQVMCADQAEVDHYWDALSEGGKKGPCGWLTDRFGLCWQVVPSGIAQWLSRGDPEARDRAFEAMMGMSKPDIATLQKAVEAR